MPALSTNILLEAVLLPGDHPVAVAVVYLVWYLLFERLVLAAVDLEQADQRRLDALHRSAALPLAPISASLLLLLPLLSLLSVCLPPCLFCPSSLFLPHPARGKPNNALCSSAEILA